MTDVPAPAPAATPDWSRVAGYRADVEEAWAMLSPQGIAGFDAYITERRASYERLGVDTRDEWQVFGLVVGAASHFYLAQIQANNAVQDPYTLRAFISCHVGLCIRQGFVLRSLIQGLGVPPAPALAEPPG